MVALVMRQSSHSNDSVLDVLPSFNFLDNQFASLIISIVIAIQESLPGFVRHTPVVIPEKYFN